MSNQIQEPHSRPDTLPYGRLRINGFTPLLEVTSDGSRLRPYPDRTLLIPERLEVLHTMVMGKPGSGKSTRVIERIIEAGLSDSQRSLIVVDPGKALQSTVHGLAATLRPGARVFHFDWLDPAHSCRWNLLSQVKDRSSASQVSRLLSSMTPIGREETRYFHQRAERLLTHILLALRERDGEPTLRELRKVIDAGHGAILPLAGRGNSPVLGQFAHELREFSNGNTMTTFSELESWFSFAEDDRIVETTSSSSFDPTILEEEPCVVYVGVDEPAIDTLRPILNLFLKSALDSLIAVGTRNGGPLRRPVSVVVDECPRLGRIIGLETLANTLRKRRVGLTFALQSTEQIEQVYANGAGTFMAAFNNHIFVPPVSDADASRASLMSGLIHTQSATTEADGVTPAFLSSAHRPLLTAHEVINPPSHPRFGPLMTFKWKDLPMFQGYLRAGWEFESIRSAREAWHPGLLPVVSPGTSANTDGGSLPSIRLTQEEAEKLTPGILAAVQELLAGAVNRWPLVSLGQLQDVLLENIPEKISACFQQVPFEEQRKLMRQLRHERLDWANTDASVRRWWRSLERSQPEALPRLLRLAFALMARKTTLKEFFEATLTCPVADFEAMLHYFDYQKRLMEVESTVPRRFPLLSPSPSDDVVLDEIPIICPEDICDFGGTAEDSPSDNEDEDPGRRGGRPF